MSSASPREDFSYRLYGVLVHAGRSTHSGHYFAYVRAPTGGWYLMDDSTVTQVKEAAVMSQKAYMLFYARQQPPAGGAPGGAQQPAGAKAAVQPAAAAAVREPAVAAPLRRAAAAAAEEAAAASASEQEESDDDEPEEQPTGRGQRAMMRAMRRQLSPRHQRSPSLRLFRDSRMAGRAHLQAQRAHRNRRRSLSLVAEAPAAAPAAAPAKAPAAAKRAAVVSRVNTIPPRAAAAAAVGSDDEAGEAAALAAHLNYPKKWGQFGSDSVGRWEGVDSGEAAAADALVRSQRPSFKRKAEREEWDEEYDRGKVKKLRARKGPLDGDDEDSGRPNPFQARAKEFKGGRPTDSAKRGAGKVRRAAEAERSGRGGGRGRGGAGRGGGRGGGGGWGGGGGGRGRGGRGGRGGRR
jgi:hypothetical protein